MKFDFHAQKIGIRFTIGGEGGWLKTHTHTDTSVLKGLSTLSKCEGVYSRVPNRRDGWNKRDGRTFPSKSISVMVLINVMVGKFQRFLCAFFQEK